MINRRTFNTLAMTSLAGAGLLGLSACGGSGSGSDSKTFVIWDYESDDSAMGQAWARAIEIFKEKHPDVTVKTEDQTFEQL